MNSTAVSGMLALVLAPACFAAWAATAQVEFVNPEAFTDAGRKYQGQERDENLERLRRHIVEQAQRRLPADQVLTVQVLDVDIAGYYDPRQKFASEVRVVKDIYPPRIKLRFKLASAEGTVLKEGETRLTDPNFLTRASRYSTDGLGYEKTMLDSWFRKEFPQPKKR
ncbi:MAG TPA: DUF3016 domain-containing protein [Usitatibacter sp.]|jgi:hypothetical protein|nr:DUF3016 domain-containing protein [Usitatibacter sp.]